MPIKYDFLKQLTLYLKLKQIKKTWNVNSKEMNYCSTIYAYSIGRKIYVPPVRQSSVILFSCTGGLSFFSASDTMCIYVLINCQSELDNFGLV